MGIEKTVGSKKFPTKFECKEFKGNKFIDLRNYYLDNKSGELNPTKKGIALNRFKLQEFLSFINEHQEGISNFFEDDQPEVEIKLVFQTLIGRKFHIQFDNGETQVFLDESFRKKYNEQEVKLIKKMLLFFYKSLLDTLDPNDSLDQIESILNFLNNKLIRI